MPEVALPGGAERRKTEFREIAKNRRATLLPEDKRARDAALVSLVLSLPEYLAADLVLCYAALRLEPDLRPVAEDALRRGKPVAFPRCGPERGDMRFYTVSLLCDLAPGAYGIPEPPPVSPANVTPRTLCLAPGLCFSPDGRRLGRGGGYYDRFLVVFPGVGAGVCYEEDLSGDVPATALDRPVDLVVTDKRVFRR